MPYIIIDTEGTGIFRHKNPDGTVARSDEPGQPRMAEYAHVLVNDYFEVEETYQQYIYPNGWEMPEEAFRINGLSTEFLRENGQPVEVALRLYLASMTFRGERRAFIGFNQQHDGRQLRGELRRAGLPDEFEETPSICAMRSMQQAKLKIKKLNGKGGFPRLIDAAAHFNVPGYEVERHHKALDDALATLAIAKELHRIGKLLPAEVHYNRQLGEQA